MKGGKKQQRRKKEEICAIGKVEMPLTRVRRGGGGGRVRKVPEKERHWISNRFIRNQAASHNGILFGLGARKVKKFAVRRKKNARKGVWLT